MSNGAERLPLLRGIGSAARTSGAAWTTGDIGNLDGDHRSGAEMGRFRGRTNGEHWSPPVEAGECMEALHSLTYLYRYLLLDQVWKPGKYDYSRTKQA